MSTPRLLAGAAALAAGKKLILDHGHETGGASWLILAFWAGRIVREVQEARGDRKGKRKESNSIWDARPVGPPLSLIVPARSLRTRCTGALRQLLQHNLWR